MNVIITIFIILLKIFTRARYLWWHISKHKITYVSCYRPPSFIFISIFICQPTFSEKLVTAFSSFAHKDEVNTRHLTSISAWHRASRPAPPGTTDIRRTRALCYWLFSSTQRKIHNYKQWVIIESWSMSRSIYNIFFKNFLNDWQPISFIIQPSVTES